MHHGSCLCGAVRFQINAELKAADACHCQQCRKQSGHFFASTNVARDALTIQGEASITWYQSSEKVRRGFCQHCGSFLFWDPIHKEWTAVAMGAFDTPTQTHLEMHIHVAEKGDYYELSDGLVQHPH